MLETDDGATVPFHLEGLATLTDSGMRRLLGMAARERRRPVPLAQRSGLRGRGRGALGGPTRKGFDVVLHVMGMVWEAVSA